MSSRHQIGFAAPVGVPPCPVAHGSRQGIALIIVMISVFVLMVLAGGFAYSMRVETRLARNTSSETELEWMGRSTVEYTRWVLANSLLDPQRPWDSLDQPWATGHGFLGPSNAPIAQVQNPLPFRKGTATWKITDLESRININQANEPLLQQCLMGMGVDAGQMTPIVNSILDWIDRDDQPHVEGAESEYYQSLSPPYYAKNGPIDDLSELLLIKGVTPDLFWGPASTNHAPGIFLPRIDRSAAPNVPAGYPFGLVDIFTPLSTGRVNINTASEPVLQVLLNGDAMAAQRLMEVVRSNTGADGNAMPVGSPGFGVPDALVSAGLSRQAAMAASMYFVTRSSTFKVTVDAEINGYHRTFVAILGRMNQNDVKVLNFYWKD